MLAQVAIIYRRTQLLRVTIALAALSVLLASLLISRMAVPVLYFMAYFRKPAESATCPVTPKAEA